MENTTTILVPLDFSKCSENALAVAVQLADKIHSKIIALHVVHLTDGGGMENFAFVPDDYQLKTEIAQKGLDESIASMVKLVRRNLSQDPDIDTLIEVGAVETTICEAAEKHKVDYIIMGTQGEVSVLDKYMGSTAYNVIKHAPCPVMAIPENANLPQNLVLGYATDFSAADVYEIWKSTRMFRPFKPIVKCVHFYESATEDTSRMKELELYFKETNPDLDVELFNLPIHDKLKDMNNFIKREHINVFIMFKPKRGFFESLFHSSWTKELAMHSSIPLLVYKDE